MEVKILEIRDYMTFIPVAAIKMWPDNEGQNYLLHRAGYCVIGNPQILVMKINDSKASSDPYGWGDRRTMRISHEYIQNNFNMFKDGDVIDVQFILGETNKKVKSEREET